MEFLNALPAIAVFLLIIFFIVLTVGWIILPFAVFGIKKRLDRLIEQNEQIIKRRPQLAKTSGTQAIQEFHGNRETSNTWIALWETVSSPMTLLVLAVVCLLYVGIKIWG